MKISAFSSALQSFSSNTPVWNVRATKKDGSEITLPAGKLRGPIQAFVQRLNDTYSREAEFMREQIPDFRAYELATSSIVGRNSVEKKHIFYGLDACDVNSIRENHHRYGNKTKKDTEDEIYYAHIAPFHKKERRTRADSPGTTEPIGVVLYAYEDRPDHYKLTGAVRLTDATEQREYGKLEALPKKPRASRKKVAAAQTSAPQIAKPELAKKEEEKPWQKEGLLFDVNEFNDPTPNHWEYEAMLPMPKIKRRKK